MSTVANVKIETWGNKFIVVGEFNGLSEIAPIELYSYAEALKEMVKVVRREEIRYESGYRKPFNS